jgi:hypothetical protein
MDEMKGVKKKQQAFIFRAYKVPESERESICPYLICRRALAGSAHAELEIEAADRPNQTKPTHQPLFTCSKHMLAA